VVTASAAAASCTNRPYVYVYQAQRLSDDDCFSGSGDDEHSMVKMRRVVRAL